MLSGRQVRWGEHFTELRFNPEMVQNLHEVKEGRRSAVHPGSWGRLISKKGKVGVGGELGLSQ